MNNDLKRKERVKVGLKKIKSKYILQKIFNILEKKKLLNIEKYNKIYKKE